MKPIKVLVVEDEAIIILSAKATLYKEFENIEVYTDTSGDKAIITAKSIKPDIILMDVNLGNGCEIEGILAAKKIREFSNVPILFITGYPERFVEKDINTLYPCGIIGKPFNHKILKPTIQMALTHREKIVYKENV